MRMTPTMRKFPAIMVKTLEKEQPLNCPRELDFLILELESIQRRQLEIHTLKLQSAETL